MLPTRNFVLHWLSAIALGFSLAAAAPAGATVRTALFSWAPATGSVAGYHLYLSVDGEPEENYGSLTPPNAVIMIESGAEVVMTVAAFDSSGRVGPRSDPSSPLRLCPGDFDGDELIEASDLVRVQACTLKPATGTCAGADRNHDGSVTISDVLWFEEGADACLAAVDGCPGDMDGDGQISSQDVSAISSCLGLYAQGNCSDADSDGSGFISNLDVLLATRANGTNCSDHF